MSKTLIKIHNYTIHGDMRVCLFVWGGGVFFEKQTSV